MNTFRDNHGTEWSLSVDAPAIKRVRSLLGVNLLEVVDRKLPELLVTDPLMLCDIIYCLVKPEADERNMSEVDFCRAMGGDAIDHATAALLLAAHKARRMDEEQSDELRHEHAAEACR